VNLFHRLNDSLPVEFYPTKLDFITILIRCKNYVTRPQIGRQRIAYTARIDDPDAVDPSVKWKMRMPDEYKVCLAPAYRFFHFLIAHHDMNAKPVIRPWRSVNGENSRAIRQSPSYVQGKLA
jgi:hypothetical protein